MKEFVDFSPEEEISNVKDTINSQWIEPDTSQRFEVQFHARISYEAEQLTHTSYERLRTHQADKFEQLVLEAFQRKASAEVPIPPGAADIPDYRREAQMPERVI